MGYNQSSFGRIFSSCVGPVCFGDNLKETYQAQPVDFQLCCREKEKCLLHASSSFAQCTKAGSLSKTDIHIVFQVRHLLGHHWTLTTVYVINNLLLPHLQFINLMVGSTCKVGSAPVVGKEDSVKTHPRGSKDVSKLTFQLELMTPWFKCQQRFYHHRSGEEKLVQILTYLKWWLFAECSQTFLPQQSASEDWIRTISYFKELQWNSIRVRNVLCLLNWISDLIHIHHTRQNMAPFTTTIARL